MEIDTSWHDWKKTLGRAVNSAEFPGMSDENINKTRHKGRHDRAVTGEASIKKVQAFRLHQLIIGRSIFMWEILHDTNY